MKLRKPIIVTMGEPSGISSEIIIKTWLKRKSLNVPQFILIDDLLKLKKINRILSLQANFQTIQRVEDAPKVFNISLPVSNADKISTDIFRVKSIKKKYLYH